MKYRIGIVRNGTMAGYFSEQLDGECVEDIAKVFDSISEVETKALEINSNYPEGSQAVICFIK